MIEKSLESLLGEADGIMAELKEGILELCLNRPPVNAFNTQMWTRLYLLIRSVHEADEVRSVLVTSANERIFCAGADMKEKTKTAHYGAANDFMRLAREATMSIYECPVPVVMAARGVAVGGGVIMLGLADLVVGGPGTVLTLSEIDRGVVGGTRTMARLLPEPLMRKMMLLGVSISGEELDRACAFTAYVADEEVVNTARDIAATIAAKDPLSVRCNTQALTEVENLDIRMAYRVEQKYTVMMRGAVLDQDERFQRD